MRNKIGISLLLLCLAFSARGQEPELMHGPRYHYNRAVELYQQEMWGAAQDEFQRAANCLTVDDQGIEMRTRYYIALCAAHQHHHQAGVMLESFVRDYPKSIVLSDIYFALGKYYSAGGDHRRAYDNYRMMDRGTLAPDKMDEFYYRLGYAAYQLGEQDEAYQHFTRVTSDPGYVPHATYYKSYILYARGDLVAAKRGFVSIAQEPVYQPIIPFYLLQIEFQQENYDYVIEQAPDLLARATGERKVEISRILSESYFHLADYPQALHYITTYEELGGHMGREEIYLAGFCNYEQMNYSVAVKHLSVLATTEDRLGQNASFHLGDSYIQLGDKVKAMGAFLLASTSDFDLEIKEESMFNYGKLQYDLGGGVFNEAIRVLSNYVKSFPTSPHIDEAREVLLAAYFNSRNYEAAYEAVKSIRNPDNSIKVATQKIAYFRGLEFFEKKDYAQALSFFNIADQHRYNPKYTALTRFWRAEIMTRQDNFTQAIPLYKEYVALAPPAEAESISALYNLGYCYFNTKDWSEAASWFEKFLAAYSAADDFKADTYNRLGDIAFAQRNYPEAIIRYDQAIQSGLASADYARFQRAVMLGLTGKRDSKIQSLQSIINTGKGDYVDDALYELGRTYVQLEKFNEGAQTLRQLISSYPESQLCLTALTDLGLTYQNLGNDLEALRYYKMVVETYPNTRQAQDALLGIRNIYVDRNEIDTYLAYAQKSGLETNLGARERDSLSFAAANRVYQNGGYAKALLLMDTYLNQHTKGVYRADALFALGDCSLHLGNRLGALAAFEEVAAMSSSPYQAPALQRAARIQAEDGQHEASALLYQKLMQTAPRPAMVVEAMEGYLRQAIASAQPQAMSRAADEVLTSSQITPELTQLAHFAKAKVLQASDQFDAAIASYREVLPAFTQESSESYYRIIEILFEQGQLTEAQNTVYAMVEHSTAHQYWLGKAFLVLGDIFVKNNEILQAKSTFRSIVQDYENRTDGVVASAQAKLDALK